MVKIEEIFSLSSKCISLRKMPLVCECVRHIWKENFMENLIKSFTIQNIVCSRKIARCNDATVISFIKLNLVWHKVKKYRVLRIKITSNGLSLYFSSYSIMWSTPLYIQRDWKVTSYLKSVPPHRVLLKNILVSSSSEFHLKNGYS